MNIDLMEQIQRASGRLEKEALLARETDARFLRLALDPAITFGVTLVEDDFTMVDRHPVPGWWELVDQVCDALARREVTGLDAASAIHRLMSIAPSERHVRWACRVINKDLRCGVNLATLQKVFPGLVQPFTCMLAQEYDPAKDVARVTDGNWCAQAKLDGLRMIVVDGQAFTRNGKRIETVGHVLEELDRDVGRAYVFDGEVMGAGDFNEASGATRRKGTGPDLSLRYHVFDAMPANKWHARESPPLFERMMLVGKLVGLRYTAIVPIISIGPNPAACRDGLIADGFEGVMFKDLRAPYEWKRSRYLLKYKAFETIDGLVVDFFEGKGKHRDRLGGIVVEHGAGARTRVGSGWSDDEREALWAGREALLGRVAECSYQNLSKDGVMRFPTFVRWRDDK